MNMKTYHHTKYLSLIFALSFLLLPAAHADADTDTKIQHQLLRIALNRRLKLRTSHFSAFIQLRFLQLLLRNKALLEASTF